MQVKVAKHNQAPASQKPESGLIFCPEPNIRPALPEQAPAPGWRQGWKEARWAVYFLQAGIIGAIASLPLVALLRLIPGIQPGDLEMTAWAVAAGCLVWAMLRDGPDGVMGRLLWWPLMIWVSLRVFNRAFANPGTAYYDAISLAGYTFEIGMLIPERKCAKKPATAGRAIALGGLLGRLRAA